MLHLITNNKIDLVFKSSLGQSITEADLQVSKSVLNFKHEEGSAGLQ